MAFLSGLNVSAGAMLELGYSGSKTLPLIVLLAIFVFFIVIVIIANRRHPPSS
jgi:hypothetical protein